MLEFGEILRTWALRDEPAAGQTIAARALADHRPMYLDYEGPVSGGRGTVSKWDGGNYEAVEVRDGLVVAQLSGGKLAGRAVLELAADHSDATDADWQFRFTSD